MPIPMPAAVEAAARAVKATPAVARFAVVVTGLVLAGLAAAPVLFQGSAEADVVGRSAGPDRVATAVAASRDHRTSAEHALLATAESFPDALSAGVLAADLNAPLLLTPAGHLPQAVGDELERLGASRVTILGGRSAVSAAVEQDLADRGYDVDRLAGQDRYETARRVATEAGASPSGDVVVALGDHERPEQAWPDAVTSGALAASPDRVPTLLTAPGQLPAATEAGLAELDAERVILVGGTAAIAEPVEQRIVALGYEVTRMAGGSRYDTSVAVATDALGRIPGGDLPVVLASGETFPDALAAASLAADLGGLVLLVPPTDLAASGDAFLRAHEARWHGGVFVGGTAAGSDALLEQASAALADRPVLAPAAEQRDAAYHGHAVAATFEGEASWYGPGFHGRRTANGETFDRGAMTAAHRSLPFGTLVRVTNLATGRPVVVRINDRGPYAGGRVIDLSEAAAGQIGMVPSGTARVRAEVLR